VATAREKYIVAIYSAKLSPTKHSILRQFVGGAIDPDLTANFSLSNITLNPEVDIEIQLRKFKQDWRRLVTKSESNMCN
jgi:hypothetical protein